MTSDSGGPGAGGSPLEALRARHEQLVAEQTTDIPVPDWSGPTLKLRVGIVEHGTIRRYGARVDKAKTSDARSHAELASAAGVIGEAVKVVVIDDEVELPLDDERLLAALGLDADATVLETLQAMCLGRDGILLGLSNAVVKHSGYSQEQLEGDYAGE